MRRLLSSQYNSVADVIPGTIKVFPDAISFDRYEPPLPFTMRIFIALGDRYAIEGAPGLMMPAYSDLFTRTRMLPESGEYSAMPSLFSNNSEFPPGATEKSINGNPDSRILMPFEVRSRIRVSPRGSEFSTSRRRFKKRCLPFELILAAVIVPVILNNSWLCRFV